MRLKYVYLVLSLVGLVLPFSQFIPWLAHHGPNFPLLVSSLFSNQISAFFALDVIISALVLWVFVIKDGARLKMAYLWVPIVASLIVGVSFAFPLFLYMRERTLLTQHLAD